MQGTREYLKTITDKQYQKYPKTFLTNESYMNDYSEEIKETGIDQLERMKYRRKLLGLGGCYETVIQRKNKRKFKKVSTNRSNTKTELR